jgi:DNA-binding LacI/PurR family transcriptional regulator
MTNEVTRRQPKRINSTDVAKLAGVSRATVSYVLSGRRNYEVPASTKERVLAAANSLGYKPNTLARGLSRGTTSLIGVYRGIHEDSFHDRIVHGVHEECSARGYSVLLSYLHVDEAAASERFLKGLEFQISGAIRIIGSLSPGEAARLRDAEVRYGTPVVLVDDRSNCSEFDCVVTDDVSGAFAAVSHLIGLGHKRIGHIGGGGNRSTAPDRVLGYIRAHEAAGLDLDPELQQSCAYEADNVDTAMGALLGNSSPPTAIFAANDRLAAMAREFARIQGLRVPEDLSLIGYGDMEYAQVSGLSTVDQHPEELGRQALIRLFERIADPDLPPKMSTVPTRLIPRASTAPPRTLVLCNH